MRDDTSDLEVLTWTANTAAMVAEQLLHGWASIKNKAAGNRIHENLGVRDLQLLPATSSPTRRLSWNPRNQFRDFHAVILAVGFGVEKTLAPLPENSYWRDGRLAQDEIGSSRRYLISGTGDGGLTDSLRAAIARFHHHKIVADLALAPASNLSARRIAQRLLEIEQKAQRLTAPDEAAEHITLAYKSLKDQSDFVLDKLRDRLSGRVVILNGRGPYALTTEASILNRYLVSLLIELGAVDYWFGAISEGSIVASQGGGWQIMIEGRQRNFDEIIIRHGTSPALDAGFPQMAAACRQLLMPRNSLDQTRDQLWPKGWFTSVALDVSTLPGADGGTAAKTSAPSAVASSNVAFEKEALRMLASGQGEALLTSIPREWATTRSWGLLRTFLQAAELCIRPEFALVRLKRMLAHLEPPNDPDDQVALAYCHARLLGQAGRIAEAIDLHEKDGVSGNHEDRRIFAWRLRSRFEVAQLRYRIEDFQEASKALATVSLDEAVLLDAFPTVVVDALKFQASFAVLKLLFDRPGGSVALDGWSEFDPRRSVELAEEAIAIAIARDTGYVDGSAWITAVRAIAMEALGEAWPHVQKEWGQAFQAACLVGVRKSSRLHIMLYGAAAHRRARQFPEAKRLIDESEELFVERNRYAEKARVAEERSLLAHAEGDFARKSELLREVVRLHRLAMRESIAPTWPIARRLGVLEGALDPLRRTDKEESR